MKIKVIKEYLDSNGQPMNVEFASEDEKFEFCAKWDGCVDISEDSDNIHVCNLYEFIEMLQEVCKSMENDGHDAWINKRNKMS